MTLSLGFLEVCAIADVAAYKLSIERPQPNADRLNASLRSFMRGNAVRTLRALWATGDVDARQSVAARVLIWLDKDEARIRSVMARIKEGGR